MKAIVALSAKRKSTTEKMVSEAEKTNIETIKIFRGSQIGLSFQKYTCYCKTK